MTLVGRCAWRLCLVKAIMGWDEMKFMTTTILRNQNNLNPTNSFLKTKKIIKSRLSVSPVSTRTQRARSFLFARIQPRLHTKEKQAESSIIKDLNNVPWINHNNKATRFKTSANEIDCNAAPIASPLGNNQRNFLSNVNKLFMLTSFAETSSSPRLMSFVFVCILVELDFHEIMIFFDFHLTPQRHPFGWEIMEVEIFSLMSLTFHSQHQSIVRELLCFNSNENPF